MSQTKNSKTHFKNGKPKIGCKERKAFLMHRWGAGKRGISFEFTYEEWLGWWEANLGPDWFKLRGRGTGQYVMARYGDVGPYNVTNVKSITMGQNCREATIGRNRGNAKLTAAQVRDIYLQLKKGPRGIARLARQHAVDRVTVKAIRNKVTWRHVTDLLD